jgi:hypothetical protein
MPGDEASPPAVARAPLGPALSVRRDEEVLVVSWNHTLPWATACVAEARRRGAHPTLLLEDEAAFWKSFDLAPVAGRWSGLTRSVRAAIDRSDVVVYFPGPADRPRLHALPPSQSTPFLGRDDDWLQAVTSARARGLRCLLGYASDAQAEHWRVPAAMWRSQLIRGITEVDAAEVARDGRKAARLLAGGKEIRITAGNGTDVTLRLRGRRPWLDDGVVDAADRRLGHVFTMSPAGAVVVAIDEKSAAGSAIANRPSFLSPGRVEGGQWEIEHGHLRNYWYTDGGEVFEADFAEAPRGRDVVALFALGLNPALAAGVPHAEDQEAGTVTLAIGGNSLYGGSNRCRYLSWLTIGEAAVAVDGVPLCDRGKIL